MQTHTYFSKSLLIKQILFIAVVFNFLSACSKSAEQKTTTVDCSVEKSFTADIKPIAQNSCSMDTDCHGSDSTGGPGELLTYPEIFNARAAIRSAVTSGVMP